MDSTGQQSAPRQEHQTALADGIESRLEEAASLYRRQREEWERQAAELDAARSRLASAEQVARQLSGELEEERSRLDRQRREAERQRERAEHLRHLIADIHGSLFQGNLYQHILRACLTITRATRGLYVTWRQDGGSPRVRAAVEVDGYPQAPPSEFLRAVCSKVLDSGESFISNQPGRLPDLPQPEREGERFHNCLAAPVTLLKHFDGVLIAADKAGGDFDEEDVEALLSVGGQAAVALRNLHLQRELQHAYVSTISMLADAVEAKDPYTHGHCELASRYARLICDRLVLSEEERSVVCYAALLHDVGKIGVSDGVLNKPGPLLPEERELMRAHVRVGHDLLAHVPVLHPVANAVLHHHEWFDGTGYPDGIKGLEIPIASRIVSAVDAYCAMITRRSYKEAYTEEHARSELRRCAGTQFDPKIVEIFLEVLDSPEGQAEEDDYTPECGLLPGFGQLHQAGEPA
ncbi:MAG: HD domain-containing protein [Gemmatimonadota bacterium]|nr:HD domain-containing protein [Gemmatimonadota bacterium]